jgi:hypothetical protein
VCRLLVAAAAQLPCLAADPLWPPTFDASVVVMCSMWYYIVKLCTNAVILAGAVALATLSPSILAHVCSAILLALFWQQCGWLSHDFLHHQVFSNRMWGDAVGYVIGNVAQGFSVSWWKQKHNTHHAVPNVLASQNGVHNGTFLQSCLRASVNENVLRIRWRPPVGAASVLWFKFCQSRC